MLDPLPAGDANDSPSLDQMRRDLLAVVRARGYRRFDDPITLASGELSHDFIDGKAACANGQDLTLACRTMLALARVHASEFAAVGGLTLGADHFSHGIAMLSGSNWFTVRKQPKGRGTNQRVEGHALQPDDRVLLVDDVVTTGGSIRTAYEAIRALGADVVFATTLIDRGEVARAHFDAEGVPYEPVFTYRDLDIEPVGHGQNVTAAAR